MSDSTGSELATSGQPVGLFYTWWRGDPLPALDPIDGFSLIPPGDLDVLARLSDLSRQEADARMQAGHQPYLALIDDEPAAYGWSAWKRAGIGELGIDFELPSGNRYLWDFVTRPDYRGRGIYPHMLQEIIRCEYGDAERFWIGHDLDNVASSRGIEKAGLPVIGEVWLQDGSPVFVARQPGERAEAAAELLRLALANQGAR